MEDDGAITGKILLQHMQGMKQELSEEIGVLGKRIDRLEEKVDRGFQKAEKEFAVVHQELDEARLHRQALQEDLQQTMRVQFQHGKKLAKLAA